MVYNDLSDEAKEVVKSMVYHCINIGACMGMDEGFKNVSGTKKHKFREELEAFSDFNVGFQPTKYAAAKPSA